jgi:enterochelin esterase-like enzyme
MKKRQMVVGFMMIAAAMTVTLPAQQPPAQPARGQQPQGPDMNAYYMIGPDSQSHEGVPKGEVRGPFTLPSQAYPGTQHTYWVYVPGQYDPAVPASVMIFQDGQAFKDRDGVLRTPNVLDNLIYRREIPVMLSVFINPGRTPEQPEPTPRNWGDRDTNRPTEYNSLDDRYARVIVDELMPVLYKEYNISKDPERHGIGGASSGAIAAFTVAWQRPNDFRKVLSIVGSFVNLGDRGGDTYAEIVRKSEKKPLRVFLQDGRNDNRGQGRGGGYDPRRDWFLQNVRLKDALAEKGYDLNYTWGMNTHGQRMGGPILPEMMRWLWRDHQVSTDPNDTVERGFNAPRK